MKGNGRWWRHYGGCRRNLYLSPSTGNCATRRSKTDPQVSEGTSLSVARIGKVMEFDLYGGSAALAPQRLYGGAPC
ncbi:unnamed protein product [Brassica oleracea var. botrytis]|uniref:Uncharacterized protein n=1 Tax=Brassica carinata TaxID=52824 RepID=A0A8X7UW01_BRACI|nr:hypothetical protein Bca52824_039468 [Brassica carinata]